MGGVVEFYPTKRIITRFDAGDTIVRYRSRDFTLPDFQTPTSLTTFRSIGETRHNFQFIAGVGFRF